MKLDYYQAIAREVYKEYNGYKKRNWYLGEYDKILTGNWDIPDAVKKQVEGLSAIITSTPVDGIDRAIKTFATRIPSMRVFPLQTNAPERMFAEMMEDDLMFHFKKANQMGGKRPLSQTFRSVLEKGATVFQVRSIQRDYGKSNTAYSKAIKRRGDFYIPVHDVSYAYPRFSSIMMESMTLIRPMSAADLIREQSRTGKEPWVRELKDKITSKKKSEEQAELEKFMLTFHDFENYEKRVIWISLNDKDDTGGDRESITIMNEDHGLPFLNWVYEEMDKSLLKTVVDFGSWNNQNLNDSLRAYVALVFAAMPRFVTNTISGKAPKINYSQVVGTLGLHTNEKFQATDAPQVHADMEIMAREGEQRLAQQMAVKTLLNLSEIATSTPFATVNALQQIAESELTLAIQAEEAALTQLFYQELEWIDFSKNTLRGTRIRPRRNYEDGGMLPIGQELLLGKGDFEPYDRLIEVKLRPATPTDRQARLNEAILLKREFPVSSFDALEEAGLDDMRWDEQAWMDEQFERTEIANQQGLMTADAQLVVQQKQLELQNPQNQAQGMSGATQFETSQGAPSPNAQGIPAQVGAPGTTREQITGTAAGGEQIG